MTMQITIQEMLRRYSEKKNAGKFLNHDRTTTLGASEVGGCIRKAWYHKHHQAPDEDYKQTSGAADRGNLIEDYWIVPAILSELPKELELLKQLCWDEKNYTKFGFEIINQIINKGGNFQCIQNPNIKIVDIDSSKDIQKAKEILL